MLPPKPVAGAHLPVLPPHLPQPTCGHRQHALCDVHRGVRLLDAAKALNQAQLEAAASDHLQEARHGSVPVAVKLQQGWREGG